MPRPRQLGTPVERFLALIQITETCWLWRGYEGAGGYGRFAIEPRDNIQAHRFSYQLFVGLIPKGLVIDHLCRVHLCVNPDHLEAVTSCENSRRGIGIPAI